MSKLIKKWRKNMSRMKTFFKYAMWVILFFIFSEIMININLETVYRNIGRKDNLPQITIYQAQATKVNGRIKFDMFKELNPLLHSELRLAVMSLLISVEEADFVYIRQQTKATAGNLSVQLDKLSKAGYVEITKTFKGKMPCTLCRITPQGVDAFEEYIEALKSYLVGKL